MRVAYFFEYPTVSGAEGSALQLLASVDRSRVEPVAFAPPHGELAERLRNLTVQIRAFSVPRTDQEKKALLARLREEAERGKPFDLLHGNTLQLARLTGELAGLSGIPAIGHLRSFSRIGPRLRKVLCLNAFCIAVSRALKEDLCRQGLPGEKIRVIYNAVEVPPKRPDRLPIRRELTLPCSCPLLIWAGQITVRKAPDVFLEAARLCLRAHPTVHVLLAGTLFGQKEENRALWRLLQSAHRQEPFKGRLHLLGWRNDAFWLLQESTVLVHTARQEPLGRVLIEALAAGTPIVATKVGGTEEAVGHAGVLVPPGDPHALAGAALFLLEDPRSQRKLAAAGRSRWHRLFRAGPMARAVLSLWQEAISGAGPRGP